MARRKRRQFTAEQKAEAVELVKQVGNLSQVARDLDLNRALLRRWVAEAETEAGQNTGEAPTAEELKELRRLRRENKTLRMERDFLKKAAAFFAEDSKRSS